MLHLCGGVNRQSVLNTGTRKNGRGDVAHPIELLGRCIGQQGDHQIFQRDHTNLQLHQLRIGQLRRQVACAAGVVRLVAILAFSFVFSRRRRPVQPPCWLHIVR